MPIITFKKFYWTLHSKNKMRFYNLSEQRVKRVLNSPHRIEKGIAPNTLAYMQPGSVKIKNNQKIWNNEIWVMTQEIKKDKTKTIKIISAWRYPGKTKPKSENIIKILRQEFEEYIKNSN
jgi:hypothetical protein